MFPTSSRRMARIIARLAVAAATYAIDRPYDYLVPEPYTNRAIPGIRVLAPFGAGNRISEGVILSLVTESAHDDLKEIDSLMDERPILTAENIKLALWMSDRFFCTVFEALRVMLPAGMWFRNGAMRTADKTVNTASLNINGEEATNISIQKQAKSPRQAAVLKLLAETGAMPVGELCFYTGAADSAVKALEKQGILSISKQTAYRKPVFSTKEDAEPIVLNAVQQKVFDGISLLLKSEKPEAALLYGVTGSGKTPVYIKLIEETLSMGKTAIVLVPEIALTPQTMSLFISYFGRRVAVLHSALGSGERNDEWKRIFYGEVKVAVGTRSAVFAPLMNIGLIVIDEEQEHTYKSESSPRYHAREIAKYRVARSGAVLLLSSATPSIESMYAADTGKYKLFKIENRYNEQTLPPVILADMKKELREGNGGSVSSVLRAELEKNINCGEQSILFINRRGTNPLVTCSQCGFAFHCRQCSVSMAYHASINRLLCHYCGYSRQVPALCPDCGGKLKFIGAGTQKVESELLELFPGVRIIRMDSDTVTRMNSHDRLLTRFRDDKAEILLGTQMVTKGLDFENVTLVGVLSADLSLYMSDYRAHERTFSLITQVVGRSGRGGKPGRAVIQTFTPGHEVITLASKQDYTGFYGRELALRKTMGIPPVCDLLAITATGVDETAVLAACKTIKETLLGYLRGDKNIKLLGPAAAFVPKVKGRYRYRLLLSCNNTRRIRETIAHTIREFSRRGRGGGVAVFADAELYD